MPDFEKTPGEVISVLAKWGEFLEYRWQDRFQYKLGDLIRPTRFKGFEYVCSDPGYSGGAEPVLPLQIGDTVQDGSCVWTCQAYNNDATDQIDTAIWTVPVGLTKGAVATDLLNSQVKISGGSAGIYTLANKIVTRDGRTEEQEITLEVK